MKILRQMLEAIGLLLPFFRKRDPKAMQEFTELVKSQYNYLMELVERFQTDYFELSEQIKRLYAEITKLNKELTEARRWECVKRGSGESLPAECAKKPLPLP